ncbi:glycine oxidase ThiO [Spongiibacter sp. KMU-158]|uniref:D-amino-acid oxidase n=1 Tax=Spongiibacter pelagi TaxID=2760804 RepID=A0A927GVD4_9GAMM|nr:glycine oxidase ThiO [Spongiibacter pelagi]MBD2857762.1 glycine oxidase ThiO [Spongiibacter pelagi]
MSNLAIVGAGLLGRLLAWKLLQQGHSVTLFDKGSRHAELSAAKVAAAMLAPYTEVATAERKVFEYGLMALEWWPEQIAALQEQSGMTVDFGLAGSVVVAHAQDQSSLTHFQQQLRAKVPDYFNRVEQCDSARLEELESELCARFKSALYLPDEGYLDNTQLLKVLELAITQLDGQWSEFTDITELVSGSDSGKVIAGEQSWEFDWVIDTRGIGAKSELAGLRGVRGEVLWVHAPEVNLSRPVRLMHPRYKLYVSPRANNRYVIGATEIESESMAPISVRSSLELQSALYSLHSGFAEAHIEHAYTHCRPTMPDNLPVVKMEEKLLRVNGLYRHGYLLSPFVVESALACLVEHGLNSATPVLRAGGV